MKKDGQGSTKAALVRHGAYQYVRLPKEFQFEGDQVQISKDQTRVVLCPLPATETKRTKKASRHTRARTSSE